MVLKILLSTLLGFYSLSHDFHVSLTTINYSAEESTYQITIKLFTDDLEKALNAEYSEEIVLSTQEFDQNVEAYVQSRFKLYDDKGQRLNLAYLGKELEYDVTWVYVESVPAKASENLSVEITLLNEVFRDQSHIVHYYLGEKTSTALLDANKTKSRF
jgi:hypothetical protein